MGNVSHKLTVDGCEVELAWTIETSRRFAYRMKEIGHPTNRQFNTQRTAPVAYCKALWALLPRDEHAKYETPEDLFAAIRDEEWENIQAAVLGVYSDMAASDEKKSTSTK